MGNNSNKNKPHETYQNTCHPGLIDTRYDQIQNRLILAVKAKEGIDLWGKDIDPLLESRYLFLPSKLQYNQNMIEDGCCMAQGYAQQPVIFQICYLPFFYTLEKEILTRRQKNVFFREQELWKLISYLSKAALEWQKCYSEQKLGTICPSNVVINAQGQLRVVTKLTFFQKAYGSAHPYYVPPQSKQNSLVKYALNPYKDPFAVEASMVYSIGTVVMEAITLTLAEFEPAGLEEKDVMLKQLGYSPQLKEAVRGMVEKNQMERLKLRQLQEMSKNHKNRHL